jgi:hypothetical protein
MGLEQSAGFLVRFARARDVDKGEGLPRCRRGRLSGLSGMLLAWMSWLAIKDHDHGLDLATDHGLWGRFDGMFAVPKESMAKPLA